MMLLLALLIGSQAHAFDWHTLNEGWYRTEDEKGCLVHVQLIHERNELLLNNLCAKGWGSEPGFRFKCEGQGTDCSTSNDIWNFTATIEGEDLFSLKTFKSRYYDSVDDFSTNYEWLGPAELPPYKVRSMPKQKGCSNPFSSFHEGYYAMPGGDLKILSRRPVDNCSGSVHVSSLLSGTLPVLDQVYACDPKGSICVLETELKKIELRWINDVTPVFKEYKKHDQRFTPIAERVFRLQWPAIDDDTID